MIDFEKLAQAQGAPDTGQTYYRHWLATIEHLIAEKGVASAEVLRRIAMHGSTLPIGHYMGCRSNFCLAISRRATAVDIID